MNSELNIHRPEQIQSKDEMIEFQQFRIQALVKENEKLRSLLNEAGELLNEAKNIMKIQINDEI